MTGSVRRAVGRLDSATAEDSRFVRYLKSVVLVGAAAAVVAGGTSYVLNSLSNEQAEADVDGGVEVSVPPPPTGPAIAQYVTDNVGLPPARRSDEWTTLGVADGMLLDSVDAMFPSDAGRSGESDWDNDGEASRSWTWKGLRVTVDYDLEAEIVKDPRVSTVLPAQVYASLPKGLLLGHSTVRDVVRAYGEPMEDNVEVEGPEPFYTLGYRYGAEDLMGGYFIVGSPGTALASDRRRLGAGNCEDVVDQYYTEYGNKPFPGDWSSGLCE